MRAPTTLMSKFLHDLLAPIFLKVARQTTFINGIDVIRKLDNYISHGYFLCTTKFIVIDVTDLYTMIPREGTLYALMRFLEEYSYHGRIGSLSMDCIMKMVRLILDNNYFAYENRYYQQIRGRVIDSSFTQVLAKIYMYEWEEELIHFQAMHHDIYGRFVELL